MTGPRPDGPQRSAARRLAVIMLGAGCAHFLVPRRFDAIIPPALPGRARTYTYLSGSAALVIGAGLTTTRARRPAAALAAAFFVAVMPAKLQLTADLLRDESKPRWVKAIGVVQLFWQLPLITEAIRAGRPTRT
ncbi:hypothetical protein [Microlunatus speluncae]|uniref:hypothetical protein n=1 Tax=Microlunatus speluncae TaxID=2594267 RepID=UPI0012662170|nr:hypothetical protein [Microlunatus speluncae]